MLSNLRNATRGWIAGGILLLIIAAFVLWSPNDYFGGMQSTDVATIGRERVKPYQVSRALEAYLRSERNEGRTVLQQDALRAGVHLQILDQLIAQRAVWDYAQDIGVAVSEGQVGQFIYDTFPRVRDPISDAVSEEAYAQFLGQINYTRAEFKNEMFNSIAADMVMQAFTVGTRAPSSYGSIALAFDSERRFVSVAELPITLAGNIPPPNEQQVQAFYEENAERLQTPEYRAVTIVFARVADFTPQVDIQEAQLRAEFEERREALTRPERRSLAQLSAPSEAVARDALARLMRGEAPEAVAAALNLQAIVYDSRERSGVPDSAVADAAFAMNVGDAPRVVRGQLNWAVVELIDVTPAVAPRYEDVRDQLFAEFAEIEASERMNAAVTAFEDAHSGGAAIAEAARANGLTVVSATVDASGYDQERQPVEAFVAHPELLELAFDTPQGEATDFLPAGDGADAIIEVGQITPPAAIPLEEVRDGLVQAWLGRERMRRLEEIRNDMIAAVEGGQSFAAAARAQRGRVLANSEPLTRADIRNLPAQRLGMEIFSASIGQVVYDTRIDGGAIWLAVVERIERDDPAENAERVEIGRLELQQMLGQSLVESIEAGARDRAKPKRNEALIERSFPVGDDSETVE